LLKIGGLYDGNLESAKAGQAVYHTLEDEIDYSSVGDYAFTPDQEPLIGLQHSSFRCLMADQPLGSEAS